jgi:hypothetical protein
LIRANVRYDQLDLQTPHWVRERLAGQRTGIINQICAFLLERALRCGKGCVSCGPSCPACCMGKDERTGLFQLNSVLQNRNSTHRIVIWNLPDTGCKGD